MQLSLRQRRILERFPNSKDAAGIRRWANSQPSKKYINRAGNDVVQGSFYTITVTNRRQPLDRETQSRLNRVMNFKPTTTKPKPANRLSTAERLRKLKAFKPPELDTLDAKVARQVRTQPAEFRSTLNLLYRGFTSYNSTYFENRLTLPIISVANLRDGTMRSTPAQADCDITNLPATIRFDAATLRSKTKTALLDILLHEMCHAAISELESPQAAWDAPTRGHHENFANLVNSIAERRGWRSVHVGQIDNIKTAWHWPAGARP